MGRRFKKLTTLALKRYEYIDILRGYAILMVLIDHFAIYFNSLYDNYFYNLSMLGRYGVVLFFIVSAYTLTMSLEYRKNNNEYKIYSKYFLRRFFRIAPLYYLILMYCYLFLRYVGIENSIVSDISFGNILAHLLFIDQIFPKYINSILGVEWTISVEFAFYALLPFIAFWTYKKLGYLFFVSLILSILVMAFRKYYYVDGWWLHYTILEWFYVFVGGIVLYKIDLSQKIIKNSKYLIFIILANIVIMSLVHLPFQHYYMFFTLIIFFIYIKYCYQENLYNKIISFIGKISFSIYLIHYVVLRYFKEYFEQSWINLFYSLLLIFIISVFTYFTIERNGIKLGKMIIEKIDR